MKYCQILQTAVKYAVFLVEFGAAVMRSALTASRVHCVSANTVTPCVSHVLPACEGGKKEENICNE